MPVGRSSLARINRARLLFALSRVQKRSYQPKQKNCTSLLHLAWAHIRMIQSARRRSEYSSFDAIHKRKSSGSNILTITYNKFASSNKKRIIHCTSFFYLITTIQVNTGRKTKAPFAGLKQIGPLRKSAAPRGACLRVA